MSILSPERLRRIWRGPRRGRVPLTPRGAGALPVHRAIPEIRLGGATARLDYEPGESTAASRGHSNWRGPVWMPVNFLLIEALRRFHGYLGDDFR